MITAEMIGTIERGGMVALTLVLWWLERAERLKLDKRLDDCLKHAADKRQHGRRGQ